MDELIKSPLVYQGNKFRLLSRILPLFPENIKTFIDLFGGSGAVSLNVKADKVIYNECNYRIENIFNTTLNNNDFMVERIKFLTKYYNLKKTKKEDTKEVQEIYKQSYIEFKDIVNKSKGVNIALKGTYYYILHLYSFNNLIRFNKKAEFNASYGYHTGRDKDIAINLLEKVKGKDIQTQSLSFDKWVERDLNKVDKDTFIYCDPPYLNTTAVYNEKRLTEWVEKDEIKLLKVLDDLNDRGVKWGMSNSISGKHGQHNEILKEWMKKYDVHYFDKTYQAFGHSNKKNIEVYITNFKGEK